MPPASERRGQLTDASLDHEGAARPFEEVPRMGLLRMIVGLLAPGGGRVDMRGALARQYDRRGPVVNQGGRFMRFVNLFGPDAS